MVIDKETQIRTTLEDRALLVEITNELNKKIEEVNRDSDGFQVSLFTMTRAVSHAIRLKFRPTKSPKPDPCYLSTELGASATGSTTLKPPS